MAPKRGLGRGLSNLIPTDDNGDVSTSTKPKSTKSTTVSSKSETIKTEQT